MAVEPDPAGPPSTGPTRRKQARGVLHALLVGVAGLIGGQVIALAIAIPLASVALSSDPNPILFAGLTTIGFGIGLAIITGIYMRYKDYTLSYIDVSVPSLRDVGWAVGGLVSLFVASAVISLLFSELGVPTETSSIERQARELGNPEILLVFIPLSWLAIGPGEELLYRNVVQKSLYDYFNRRSAVVVGSVVFALVHLPQYANFSDPSVLGTASTLLVIFALALILGFSYERTENLVVPIFIHGTFNAFSFYSIYFRITNDISTQAAALLLP